MKREPLYQVGDLVKIKDLDRLKQDLGDDIRAQCGWAPMMNVYAGGVYEVASIVKSTYREFHYSYKFKETGLWCFSEDTFEEDAFEADGESANISMDYDEVMAM